MKKLLFFTTLLVLVSCSNAIPVPAEGVLVVDNEADSLVLREKCREIPRKAIGSGSYVRLVDDMLTKVQSPEYEGVGIAGPQVGVNLRIVAVQRFDREGEPFEVYPNIRITAVRGEKELGPEGCLSVPAGGESSPDGGTSTSATPLPSRSGIRPKASVDSRQSSSSTNATTWRASCIPTGCSRRGKVWESAEEEVISSKT